MLRELSKNDWQQILGIPDERVPQILILRGTRNLKTQYNIYRPRFSDVMEVGAPNGLKGYTLTPDFFLAAAKTTPSVHDREDIHVRPLNTDKDWRDALEIEQQSFDSSPSFQEFLRQQMNRNRALIARGVGLWFGTFSRDKMVATMGLFVQGGLGRCQGVATALGQRRKGCFSTLVHAVCSYGFAQMGAEQIVIMTTPGSAAARVYDSVGFTLRERVSSLSVSGA